VPTGRPTAGELFRRFTLGSGPLKRSSDRWEFLPRVLLACCLLAAAPISLAVATAAYTQARDEAAIEAADRHSVPARLLEDGPVPAGDAWENGAKAQGNAVWTDPAGTQQRGTVTVPFGVKAGRVVSVWYDEDGDRTAPPMGAGDVSGRAVGQGSGTFVMLCVMASGAHLRFRVLLDRSRSRRWAADWASVEPVWTRTVP
jgi:hypothetical protein